MAYTLFTLRLQLLVSFVLLSYLIRASIAAPTSEEPFHIRHARRLVATAQEEAGLRNKFIIDNAQYRASSQHRTLYRRDLENFGRTISLIPNSTVLNAAALIAEYDSISEGLGATELKKRAGATFWMEEIAHGKSAFAPPDYKVSLLLNTFGASTLESSAGLSAWARP